jgi:transposase
MGEYSGAFVAVDVAKAKHAVAIAESGREGEIGFLGEIENSPAAIERIIKKLSGRYERLHVCYEAGPTATGCIARSRNWVMLPSCRAITAFIPTWWWNSPPERPGH